MTRLSSVLFGLMAVLIAAPSVADTFIVRPDGTGDYATIQAAVIASLDGDIIELTIIRDGEEQSVEVELATRPADAGR